mmetsp:Transcript_30779/g.99220  ORF Transcript_30779/g.99220 Transcript_30779/m.99220 type:complete len:96 (+) Transcript_30779:764-1051(+)
MMRFAAVVAWLLCIASTRALVTTMPSTTRGHLSRAREPPRRTVLCAEEKEKEALSRPEQPEYEVENPFSDLQSPVTLTFLGFAAIAFNFFVVANL